MKNKNEILENLLLKFNQPYSILASIVNDKYGTFLTVYNTSITIYCTISGNEIVITSYGAIQLRIPLDDVNMYDKVYKHIKNILK